MFPGAINNLKTVKKSIKFIEKDLKQIEWLKNF